MKRRVFLTGALALSVSACTVGRGSSEVAHYDLGADVPTVPSQRLTGSVALDEVAAGAWTLKVTDAQQPGKTGRWAAWRLTLWGR